MRFKAKLTNDQLSILQGVISPMSKLQDPSSFSTSSRFAVLYLDQEYLRISCKSIDVTCFAELSQKELFLEHRIESAADNVIVLKIDLVSLKVALQSVVQSNGGGAYSRDAAQHQNLRKSHNYRSTNGHHSTSAMHSLCQQQQVVIMKLAKRNNLPCLCLEGRSSVMAEKDVEIYQAIPVLIMRQSEMQHHLPPQINHPQVQLELPSAPPIRALVDKLKGMSKHVLMEGNMNGDLTIRIDQDGASLACFYNHLIPRWSEGQRDDQEGDGRDNKQNSAASSCVLKLDAQNLSTCLQWQQHQFPVTSCLLGMVYNEMLVLHVLTCPEQVGFFTYYLPACFLQEEDLI
jgi:HUS1 checkpoint protein